MTPHIVINTSVKIEFKSILKKTIVLFTLNFFAGAFNSSRTGYFISKLF